MTTLMSSGCPREGLLEVLRLLAARDQAGEPRAVGAGEGLGSLVPVALVRVHAADDDVVSQDELRRHVGNGVAGAPALSDAGQADDPARRRSSGSTSAITAPTPVHSMIDVRLERHVRDAARSGRSRRAPAQAPASGPDSTRSRTWTSMPNSCGPAAPRAGRSGRRRSRAPSPPPRRSAGRPSRPAPAPSRSRSSARAARRACPSDGSTLTAYSGSIRQRSDMNPWICLMPRSVYWPLRHMSHSPTAQFGHGTGSGRRTMPTTRSPGFRPAARARVDHPAE